MAIHINEIVFKATIQDDNDTKDSNNSGGGGFNEKEREKIVAMCMEQILEMMRRKQER